MSELLEKVIVHKEKIIVVIIVLLFIILITTLVLIRLEEKRNNVDISNAIHGVIIEENVIFYRKPIESKWRDIRKFELGEFVFILETVVDEKNEEWYKVKAKNKVGYVLKSKVDYYKFLDTDDKVLMSDVSKFNIIYKHFNNSEEYAAFILNSNINYVYIRLGGRGYGDEGKIYTDPNYQIFIDVCDYLGIPYGFYYIDEAINSFEIDEEIKFVSEFLQKNATKQCVLPLVIDVESHDGVGRADNIWNDRAELLSELISKFKEINIETLIYSNARTANEYLYSIDSKFWIAYYTLDKKVPKYWYTESGQEPANNIEFMNKVVGWQFTENGAGDEIKASVDASLVDNKYFKSFVKTKLGEKWYLKK